MKFQILGFSEHNENVVVLKDSGVKHNVQDNQWLTYLPPSTDRMDSLTLQHGVTSAARHSENITCRGVTSTARHAALSLTHSTIPRQHREKM
jgi:hypothetical protein